MQKHNSVVSNNNATRVAFDPEEARTFSQSNTPKVIEEKSPVEEPKKLQKTSPATETKPKKKGVLTKSKTFNLKTDVDQQSIIPEEEDEVKSPGRRSSKNRAVKEDSIYKSKDPVIFEKFPEEESRSPYDMSTPLLKNFQGNSRNPRAGTTIGFSCMVAQNHSPQHNNRRTKSLNNIYFGMSEELSQPMSKRRAKSHDQKKNSLVLHSGGKRLISEGEFDISDELTMSFKRDGQNIGSQLSESPSFSSGDTLNLFIEKSESGAQKSKFCPNASQLDHNDKAEEKTHILGEEKIETGHENHQLNSNFLSEIASETKQPLTALKFDFNVLKDDRDEKSFMTSSKRSKITGLLQLSKTQSETPRRIEKLSNPEDIHKELKTIKSEIEENMLLIGLFEVVKDLGKHIAAEDVYNKSRLLFHLMEYTNPIS